MRVVFMGTPDFAVPTLETLAAGGHSIPAVYTQPPRPAGRGKQPRPSPVAAAAERLGLEVRTPERFRDPGVIEGFATLAPDIAVVVAYGQILPQAALDVPRFGCVNGHASLLPRWRGAAPIQRAIMAGDAETGVCAMRMEAGLDTGPVYARTVTAISPDDTAATLHDRLAAMTASLLGETLPRIAAGLAPVPQPEDGVTYAAKIDKAEARIDWARPAEEVSARIRGLSPFPGAWCEIGGERVKVLMAQTTTGDGAPGTTLDNGLTVACATGAVRLASLQRAGRAAQDAETFLRGFAVAPGSRLA